VPGHAALTPKRLPSSTGNRLRIGAVTVRNGKIVELDFFDDPERLRQLDLTILDD
jgi:hypothetical protein